MRANNRAGALRVHPSRNMPIARSAVTIAITLRRTRPDDECTSCYSSFMLFKWMLEHLLEDTACMCLILRVLYCCSRWCRLCLMCILRRIHNAFIMKEARVYLLSAYCEPRTVVPSFLLYSAPGDPASGDRGQLHSSAQRGGGRST